MADLVLSPILQVVLDRLASPVLKAFGNFWDLKENVHKLQRTLPMVQAILEVAEKQKANNMAVRIWLSKLKDVTYGVEQVLLDLNFYNPLDDVTYAGKVKEVLCVLEMTADEGLRLNLTEDGAVRREWARRETSSFVIKSEVYGREEDREKILELLLFSSEATTQGGEVLSISIVGMGGLGKTTLAQLAYNDEKVAQHFDVKVWVFVSDQFNAKNIMLTVIESLTNEKCYHSTMDALHSTVWNLLYKKKYLIVLDDVWTEDQDDWEKLKPLFAAGVKGSRVLLTTRNKKVGLMIDPTVPYDLKMLSDDACWSLFKKRAFRVNEEEKYENLMSIGRQIVKKCGGVALAARTLGSLMRFKRGAREWLRMRDSDLWNLDERERGILPALRLSYFHLPPHLKRCFSFCSIFPRRYEIKKEKLIHLWMAGGLIDESNRATKPADDSGVDYFNDLLWMSFFEEIKRCDNGVVTGYKMHDIIYDLAQSIAGSEYIMLDSDFPAPSSLAEIRHSSVVCDYNSSEIPEELYEAKGLRTLLLFSGDNLREVPSKLYSSFKYLLVLDLSGSGLSVFDEFSLGELLHLKYLDLSYTGITMLPHNTAFLYSLQTLNLFHCYNLVALPKLANMKSLKHLNNDGCEALTTMLPSSYRQRNTLIVDEVLPRYNMLQTLPLFVVGGHQEIKLLQWLNLRGSLKITCLENVQNADDARSARLIKKDIESLGLFWGKDDYGPKEKSDATRFRKKKLHSSRPLQTLQVDISLGEKILQHLQPHKNLKRLLIKGYPGIRFPDWSVPNLEVVDLIDCRKSEHLPTFGDLHFLQSLSLRAMHSIRRIDKEFYFKNTRRPILQLQPFSELKELVLIDLPNLEEWSNPNSSLEAFPSLRKLILNKCPRLTGMPLISTISHLELRDCTATLVHSFQNLTSLKTLVIEKVSNLSYFPGSFPSNNPHLTSLEIKSCPLLHSLPSELGNLVTLRSLTIRWCEELAFLPPSLQQLNALESLEIGDCHSLTCLLEDESQGLNSLRTLSIENCNNLTSLSMSFRYLTSLENLTLMYCPSLGALPEGLEHLSALQSLTLLSCPQIMFLPEGLQNLTSLHSLEIRSCPSLNALPELISELVSLRSLAISNCHNISSLPDGIEYLTALQHLSIQDCPQLLERCGKQNGEDWPKIAHVPYKHIGLQ